MSSFEEDHEDEFFECAGEPNHQTMESSGTNVTSGSHKETSTLPGHEEEEEGAPSEELAQGINALEIEESAIPISSVEKSIETASKYKEDGNAYFRQKDYDNACQAYSQAIEYCPADDKENLAVFYGNRAAAYSMTADYELVIEDCDRALELKPDYVKVMGRRMQAYENIGKIEEALKDAKRIEELDSSFPKISSTIKRLQALYDEKMAKLKDEALGKLKDLGNTILGNFGLSLDNFKMVQDPNTGSWSVSMSK